MPTKKTTRVDIIERSIDLFNRKGFFGVSLQDIAIASGVGKSGLYHYFDSKDGLAAECSLHSLENNLESKFLIMFLMEELLENAPLTCKIIGQSRKYILSLAFKYVENSMLE